MRTVLKILLAGIAMVQLTACSKTVEWEEEVPLNTGEVIWVKRTVEYTLKGAGGNPFDIRYAPEKKEILSFRWGGKKYTYDGEADLILLAISPQKLPVLLAPAADKTWDWNHDYRCAIPHYVQFVPDASGHKWTWPLEIEPWLYGMPSNLMGSRRPPHEMRNRYTIRHKSAEDAKGLMQTQSRRKIDQTFIVKDCKKKGHS